MGSPDLEGVDNFRVGGLLKTTRPKEVLGDHCRFAQKFSPPVIATTSSADMTGHFFSITSV
jgi:hypothetical protein